MTPASARLVQRSFRRLLAENKLTADAVLTQLAATAPHLLHLFPDENPGEWKRLFAVFAFTVETLDDLDMMAPALRITGSRYREIGLDAEDYTLFGIAMLRALEAALGRDWSPALHHAWDEVFVAITSTMQDAGGKTLSAA